MPEPIQRKESLASRNGSKYHTAADPRVLVEVVQDAHAKVPELPPPHGPGPAVGGNCGIPPCFHGILQRPGYDKIFWYYGSSSIMSLLIFPLGQSSRNCYKNCFNQSVTGEGTRGSEGVLIANLLEPLVERLVISRKDLICQENFVLYSDLRQLMSYFKEVHGSTFRRVMLTGLLKVWRKQKKGRSNKAGKLKILDPHLMRYGRSLALMWLAN